MNLTWSTWYIYNLNSAFEETIYGQKIHSNLVYSSLGTYEKDTGMIRTKMETFHTERRVNFEEFSNSLEEKYNEYDAEGYDVVNVIPISMGQSESCTQRDGTYVGDVGFSITRGAVVVGKKRE